MPTTAYRWNEKSLQSCALVASPLVWRREINGIFFCVVCTQCMITHVIHIVNRLFRTKLYWVDWSIRVQFRINWTIRPGKFLRMWEESESQKFWSQTERAKIYLKRERESEREIANITVLRAREERGKLVELKLASKRTNDKDRVIKKNCEFPGKKNTKRRKRKRKKMPELSVFFFSCSKKNRSNSNCLIRFPSLSLHMEWQMFELAQRSFI